MSFKNQFNFMNQPIIKFRNSNCNIYNYILYIKLSKINSCKNSWSIISTPLQFHQKQLKKSTSYKPNNETHKSHRNDSILVLGFSLLYVTFYSYQTRLNFADMRFSGFCYCVYASMIQKYFLFRIFV